MQRDASVIMGSILRQLIFGHTPCIFDAGESHSFRQQGDDEFNSWAGDAAENTVEEVGKVVLRTVNEVKPVRSRIWRLELGVAS